MNVGNVTCPWDKDPQEELDNIKKNNIIIPKSAEPYMVAHELINATRKEKAVFSDKFIYVSAYSLDELYKIGCYLINYAKTEKQE